MFFYSRSALIVVLVGLFALSVNAAQTNWTGGASSAWSDAGNWDNGIPDNTKDVVLTGAGAFQPTGQDIPGLIIPSLTFDATASTAITLTGIGITLTNVTVDTASANHTIGIGTALGASSVWNIGAGRTLTMNGVISGGFDITKSGAGTLVLTAANTYTGSTTISDGRIQLSATLSVVPPAGMSLWLDATDPTKVLTSGGNITQWNDSSGNNRNFIPNNGGAAQSTYITSGAGTINGRSVVHVTSPTGSGTYSSLQNTTNFPAPCTVTYIGRLSGTTNQRLLSCVNNNWLLGYWANCQDQGHFVGWVAGNGNPALGPAATTATKVYTMTTTGGLATVYANGTQVASNSGGVQGPNGLRIGGGYNGNPTTEYSTGDVGELFVYPFVLSPGQRAQLEDYINIKWGLASAPVTILPTTTAVNLTSATAILDCNGNSQTIGSLAGAANSSVLLGFGSLTAGDATSTTFNGVISGTGGLTKAGTGDLTLGGANTFSGGTTVNGGNLIAGGVNVLSPNSTLTLAASSNFNMNGFSQSLGSLSGSGDVALGSNAATVLTVGTNNASTSYLGVISGQGGFTKSGSGTFTISFVQTYSGATAVTGGTLKLAGSIPIPPTPSPTGSTAIWLDANDTANITQAGGRVTAWADKTGNGRTLTQGTVPFQPVLVPNAIGTNSTVRFAAPNNLSDLNSYGAPVTVFAIGKMNGGANQRLVTSRNGNWLLGWWNGFMDQGYFEGWCSGNGSGTSGPFTDTTPKMYEAIIRGPGQPSSVFVFDARNGGIVQTASNTGGTSGFNGLQLGSWQAGNAEASNGDVGEIIIYNRVLTPAERIVTENYLIGKWFGPNGNGSGVSVNMLPPTTTVSLSNNATLDLGIVTQTVASISGPSGTALKMDGGLITGGDNSTTNFLGVISGQGSLTKNGTGTFTMGGVSSYAGNTTINGGTLRINNPGTGFTPFASNMSLWLDANDTAHITQAGGKVTTWSDKNGAAGNVAQTNTALQPTLAAGALNGNNAVRFTAANTLFNTTNYSSTPTGIHIFGVGKMNGGANQRLISSRTNNWLFGWWGGNMDQFHFDNWVSAGGTGPVADTQAHMYEASIGGPGVNSTCYVFDSRNGGVVQLFSNTNGTTGPNGLQLGSWLAGNNESSNGDVGEIIIYNRILNAAERAQTEAYLINRWFSGGLSPNSSVVINAGILDINGTNQQCGSLSGAAGTQVLMGGGSLICGYNNASTNYGGSLSGGGTFGKAGSGTMSIGNTLGSLSALKVLGGTLNLPFANATTAACAVTISDGGILDCTNFVQVFGSLAGSGGGKLLMGNAPTLTLGGDNTSTDFFGVISGQCNLIKNGTGVWGLGSAQQYTGSTTVNAGTLKLLGSDVPAYYSFNNTSGSTVFNDGGEGSLRDATLTGGATIVAGGKNGAGLSIPSQAAWLAVGLDSNGAGVNLAGTPYTAMAWFNGLYNTASWRTLFRGADSGGTGDHQLIIEAGSWRLGFYDNRTGGAFRPAINPANGQSVDMSAFQTGWHHIAVVGSGSTSEFYVDGVFRGTSDRKSPSNIWAIGNIQGGSQAFSTLLDDVVIYKRSLTAAEINAQFTLFTPPPTDVIPTTSVVTLNGVSILDVNGATQTLANFAGGATTQILLGNGKLTLGGNNADMTYAGNISGVGGRLVKAGTGTFTVTGNNTYNGGTTINAGVFKGNSNAVQNAIVMNNNTTVNFDQNIASGTYTGNISGNGNLVKDNTGTLNMGGGASYTGTTTINAGILRLQAAAAPTPPAGASLWLDATDPTRVIMSGSEVTQWNDSTGNATHNFTRNNAGGQIVTLLTGAAGINGRSVVHTNSPSGAGAYSSMQNGTNYPAPCTIAYVGRVTGTAKRLLSSTANNWLMGYWENAKDQCYFEGWLNPAPGTPTVDSNPYLYVAAIPGGASASTVWRNGTQILNSTAGRTGPNGLRVGGGYAFNPTTEYSTGDVGELFVYTSVLTTTQRQQLENYMNFRWGTGAFTPPTPLPPTTNVIIAASGTLDINNINTTIGSLTGAGGSFVTLGSGTLTTGNATNTTFSGQISGAGGIAKAGTGRFTLASANIYSGPTTVSAGVLEATNGAGSATGTGGVTVANTSTLTGNGIIGGSVAVAGGGIVAPGATLGKLTTGNFTPAATSVLNVELIGPDGGAANTGGDDEMLVNGNITLAGTLNLASPGTLVTGIYHLATYTGTVSGTFSSITAPGISASVVAAGGSVDLLLNHRPALASLIAQTVTEGQTIAFTASGSDSDAGQVLTYSITPPVPSGATIDPVTGAFSWTTVDGPSQSQNVTVRVTDNGPGNLFAEQTFLATVNNVAPTATFANGGAVNEGSTGTVTFSGAVDPSSADVTATFHYSYDFDNNGTFDLGGNTYALASTNASVTVPASFLADNPSRVVRGRIWDKDGGFTDYTTTITINNVSPMATLNNNGPINEGSSATVTFVGATDASPVDAASLHFSYDLDNDGNFDVGGNSYLAAVTQTSAVLTIDDGPMTRVVRGRVWDKDGGFNDYTTNIVVDSVSPTATVSTIGTLQEGSSGTITFSGEFDPSNADTVAGFHYSFDFDNNGTFDVGGTTYGTASPNPSATIPASFVVDGPASQTVRARVWDKDNSFTEYTQLFTIQNVAPALSNLQAPAVDEGTQATFTGTITDPGTSDTFDVHINWGDPGSPGNDEDYVLPASATGSQTFSYVHLYLNDPDGQPSFTITITVTDKDGASVQGTTSVFVNNATPVVSIPAGLTPHIPEHSTTGQITLATFTDSGFVDTHTVTIDWGDGSPQDTSATLIEPTEAAPGEILGNHLYDDGPGVRLVTVTVTDDEGAAGSSTFNVIVDNVEPTATFRRPDAGSFTTMTAVEFVNPADVSDADTAQGFLYSYDFNNDGTFEVSFSSITSMTIPPQYLSSQPNHIVRGRITDKDGGFSDYLLQQPYFTREFLEVTFNLGEQSSYTIPAIGEPKPTFVLTAVDLPAIAPTLEALGLSFDGVDKISGVPTLAGMVTIHILGSNAGGQVAIDLVITISRTTGGSNTPQIKSAATANPNPAITNTPIEFSVVATDADGDILSYYWDFKDGVTARGRVVTHTYTVPGTYFVSVNVSDGKHDGVSDQFNVVVAKGEDNLFDVQSAKLSFDFRKPERSTLYVTGYIPSPSGPLLGVNATVSITGTTYSQVFQFDAKGAAGDTMSLFSLKTIQTGTGTNRAKFVFSLKSTNGLDPLNPSLFQKMGVIFPNTTDRAGATVPVPLVVTIGSQPTQTAVIPMNYKVVKGRSGKGQYKRR